TNAAFLLRLMRDQAFASAELDTGLIEHRKASLLPEPEAPSLRKLAIAAAAVLAGERDASRRSGHPAGMGGPDSEETCASDPWAIADGWRHGGAWLRRPMRFGHGTTQHEILVDYARGGWTVRAGNDAICLADLTFDPDNGNLRGLAGDRAFQVGVALDGETLHLFFPDEALALHWASPLAHAGDDAHEAGGLVAPMPGKVVALLVEAGAKVARGQ